ncbi:histidine--tRNA ligase [bacterium]|nr:histidine--tRNA ligase [bacterium]
MVKFQSPTGMHDLFEEDIKQLHKIEKISKDIADFYGYKRIETPILEQTNLFEKGTGMLTDIVEKEMYSLRTKGGDHLTLRPEGTPGIVRAYIEHGMQSLPKPVKLWYMGPFFRHERPQAGRYREFYQFGFENFGVGEPVIDAEIIQIFYLILKELGVKNLIVEINSIGDSQCRPYYKKALTHYLKARQNQLCPNCRRRLLKNPLRVLDCKENKCQAVIKNAPQSLDYLCQECHNHLKSLLEFLDAQAIPYNLNPYLVRGLDYYTRTVFEFKQTGKDEEENQQTLAAGGRYDTLVKLLGGNDTPACGGAGGAERIINIIKRKTEKSPRSKNFEIFLAQVGEMAKKRSLELISEFFQAKVPVKFSLHKDSLTTQLKTAAKLNVKYVLILGQKEVLDGNIILREMKSGKQKNIPLKRVVKEVKKKIKK